MALTTAQTPGNANPPAPATAAGGKQKSKRTFKLPSFRKKKSSDNPNPSAGQNIASNTTANIQIENNVGGSEFDATAASSAKTDMYDKSKGYEAKKSILYPWRKTEIEYVENIFWKEPCFSSLDDIVPNKKKKAYTKNNFTDTFFRAYYSISELPLFGWSYHTMEKGQAFWHKTVFKFLYCFFVKVVASPLYIGYHAVRILFMLGAPLIIKIPMILAATINSLFYFLSAIVWAFSLGRTPITGNIVPWYYYPVDKVTGETASEPIIYYPALTSLMGGLFGLTIPFQTISPRLGSIYGRGEIGVFVFIVAAISAVIITLTGINVAVIMVTFVYFMLKILFGIKDKAMGIDLRKGGK